jgi:hypothetical protein
MSIKVGEYGFIFENVIVDEESLPVNLSTATAIVYTFENPDSVHTVCSGSFSTNGADGAIKYVVESTLLTIAGVWQYQTTVRTPARNWNSDITSFFVEELI